MMDVVMGRRKKKKTDLKTRRQASMALEPRKF